MSTDGMSFVWILLILVSFFLQYWIIRLAVRGGIEDAGRRRVAGLAEQELWRTIDERRHRDANGPDAGQ